MLRAPDELSRAPGVGSPKESGSFVTVFQNPNQHRTSYPIVTNAKTASSSYYFPKKVRQAGFEPASLPWQGRILDLAGLLPHHNTSSKTSFNSLSTKSCRMSRTGYNHSPIFVRKVR